MTRIIEFTPHYSKRNNFIFKNKGVTLPDDDGNTKLYPCITLYDKKTGIPVCYPLYERWYLALNKDLSSETMRQQAAYICTFLNFVLWNTDAGSLHELTINDIRAFLLDYRRTERGKDDPDDFGRTKAGWNKGIGVIYAFLHCYWESNKDELEFSYSGDDLYTKRIHFDPQKKSRSDLEFNRFGVSPLSGKRGAPHTKKNRVLVEGYLPILIMAARKYDPMLALAIALQAYAGLREGEIVNLTRKSLKLIYGGFGRITRIRIDLRKPAHFSQNWKGKRSFGKIKIRRVQDVYPAFIDDLMVLIEEHERLLDFVEAGNGHDDPLFVNKQGNPMSVLVYSARAKALFYDHFLPSLSDMCERDGSWAENAAYIEGYEKEYPGLHCLRHWFTNYLLCRARLAHDEISKWRGDSSPESMDDYVHANGEMVEMYRNYTHQFQRSLMEEIL